MRTLSLGAGALLLTLAYSFGALATPLSAPDEPAEATKRLGIAQVGDPPPPPPPPVEEPDDRLEESFEDDEPPPAPRPPVEEPLGSPGEEAFGDAAPPPVPPPPAATPPAPTPAPDVAAEPPPRAEERGPASAAPERKRSRRRVREQPSGLNPVLTGVAQVGAGVATCALCTVGSASAACMLSLVTAPLMAVPLVGTIVSGVVSLGLCTATGAAVGGVETLTGNLLGAEEASFLLPVAAGAAVGAAFGVGNLALNLGSEALGAGAGLSRDPSNPLGTAAGDPVSSLISIVGCGLCVGACVAIPVLPAVVYAFVAEPKVTADTTVRDELQPPGNPRLASAIAY